MLPSQSPSASPDAADFDRPQPRPFRGTAGGYTALHSPLLQYLASGRFSRMDSAVKRFGGGNARPRSELRPNLVPLTTTQLFLPQRSKLIYVFWCPSIFTVTSGLLVSCYELWDGDDVARNASPPVSNHSRAKRHLQA